MTFAAITGTVFGHRADGHVRQMRTKWSGGGAAWRDSSARRVPAPHTWRQWASSYRTRESAVRQGWHGDPSPTSHTRTAGSRARLPPPATPKSQGSHPSCRAYHHELFCTCPGFFALCDEPRVDAIALMFTLLCRVGAVDPIRTTFLNYIVVRVHARACLSHGAVLYALTNGLTWGTWHAPASHPRVMAPCLNA